MGVTILDILFICICLLGGVFAAMIYLQLQEKKMWQEEKRQWHKETTDLANKLYFVKTQEYITHQALNATEMPFNIETPGTPVSYPNYQNNVGRSDQEAETFVPLENVPLDVLNRKDKN